MPISRSKLYTILIIACLAGYIWLFYSVSKFQPENNDVEVCLFKCVTHIPCPSCGSTRSVISIIHGDFLQALYINPFGIIVAGIMLVTPIWILFDIIIRKKTLYDFYIRIETLLRKPGIAIPLILLVLINWIWNIIKEL